MYTENFLSKGKKRLSAVLNASGDVISPSDVVSSLNVSPSEAHLLLSRWKEQGFLKRVSRGLYVRSDMESIDSEHSLSDPWIMIPPLLAPCYIAGRTAAEFWDLTEQIFRDIVVFTVNPKRSKTLIKSGTEITVKQVSSSYLFGTKTVWRERTKVQVSDLHKTIIDIIAFPNFGGGIQHVADCLLSYYKREDKDPNLLLEYAKRSNNGAIFKRLGFLLEHYELDPLLADACKGNLTTGLTKLDPKMECTKIVTKWRIRVPTSWLMANDH